MITLHFRCLNRQTLFFSVLMLCLSACSDEQIEPVVDETPTEFVGSDQCESCHQEQSDAWRGSHHQLAMQAADTSSILGNFADATARHFDSQAKMSTRDGRFFVATENSDGNEQEFAITHTFGVYPLQQYLVSTPGGRKQALQYMWDSRLQSDGGQRWFHLYPDENIASDDALHWTGPYFNWNTMCAECHSTNLQLSYNVGTDSFATTFSEISVGCEACHGPGSDHVVQANNAIFDETHGLLVDLDDRGTSAWIMNPDTGIAQRSVPIASHQQPESCGRCHARRSAISVEYEYGRPLVDTHMVSLLDEHLYYADGRIQDEVYVYGSFVQSKMYAAGVTCSDCHNAHSGALHAGPNPNNTCATCHLATVFATPEHSEEPIGDCVSCHMPATTYMGVDDRRDHSFRLPGTSEDASHYGAIIAAGRIGNANDLLMNGIANTDVPPIARATMLSLLEPLQDGNHQSTLAQQLDHSDPLIRIGALRALRNQSPQLRMSRGSHLLQDSIRSVRIEAALTYVDLRDLLPLEDSRAFAAASDEYRQAMTMSAAMPDAALSLAEFENRLGNSAAATRMYQHALKIGADQAAVQYAYGMHLVRSGRSGDALHHFERATSIDPGTARFSYVYGVALNSLGRPTESLDVLDDARQRFPDNFDIAWALATIYRDNGERDNARRVADDLRVVFPDRSEVIALLESLND